MGTAVLTMLAFDKFATNFYHILVISLGSQAFACSGVLDGWCVDTLGEHAKTEYGKIRLWAALSWGVGCFSMSWITDYFGFNYNFILYDSLTVFSLVLMVVFVPAKTPIEKSMGDSSLDKKAACNALCNVPMMMFLLEMFIMGMVWELSRGFCLFT